MSLKDWFTLSPAARPQLALQVIGEGVRLYDPNGAANALAPGERAKPETWLGTGIVSQDPESGEPKVIGGAIAWAHATQGGYEGLSREAQMAVLDATEFGTPQTVDLAAFTAPEQRGDDPARGQRTPGFDSDADASGGHRRDRGAEPGHLPKDEPSEAQRPAKPSDPVDRRMARLIQDWFEQAEHAAERLAPLRDNGGSGADAPRGYGDSRSAGEAFARQWARTDALLKRHLEGAGEDGEVDSGFAAGFEPFKLFASHGGSALSLSVDDGRHRHVLTGIGEGWTRLG